MSPNGPTSALPPNVEGALWVLGSAFTFVAMTTLVKYLGDEYPSNVQNFYRQIASFAVLIPLLLRAPAETFRLRRLGTLTFRAASATVGMILMLYSYQHLPMAEANALSFTRPLWVTLLAVLILRETLGFSRIVAVAVGFLGVLVILRPVPGAHLGMPQFAALGSSALLALTVTGVKSLTRDLSPLATTFWSSVLGLIIGLPLALVDWRWPSPPDLVLLFGIGAFSSLNQLLFIKGMSIGDAAALAPVDYSRLVLSIIAGLLLFGEVPDSLAVVGALIVVASTLYITWSEMRARKRARLAAAAEEHRAA